MKILHEAQKCWHQSATLMLIWSSLVFDVCVSRYLIGIWFRFGNQEIVFNKKKLSQFRTMHCFLFYFWVSIGSNNTLSWFSASALAVEIMIKALGVIWWRLAPMAQSFLIILLKMHMNSLFRVVAFLPLSYVHWELFGFDSYPHPFNWFWNWN